MDHKKPQPARWAWFSPWMIIGSVCILGIVLLVLSLKHIHREEEFVVRSLLSQAEMLMRSLEAGSRSGMMGMRGWGQRNLQMLVEEAAEQPDVLYVTVVTPTGQVVADSRDPRTNQVSPFVPPPQGRNAYRFARDGTEAFEVTGAYEPWFGCGRHKRRGCPVPETQPQGKSFFIIGLNPTPFTAALSQDRSQTLLQTTLMFLAGAAGFVSLFWAQHYREARRSLHRIQTFASTIFSQMPVGLIATDPQGHIQTTNEAARRILRLAEYPAGTLDRFPCFVPLARQLKQEQSSVLEEETTCRTGSGESVPLLVNCTAIRDRYQRTTGLVFLFTDISNIRQLEEELRRSERMAALGRLASGIAHEIRNPLSSIKGFATILAGKVEDDADARKIAQVMQDEVERLNRVITELFEFARPTELHLGPHPLGDLIRHSLQLVEDDARHQGIKIETSVDPEDLEAPVDPDRIAQILLNLYLNALQAMDSGGDLRIKAQQRADEVLVSVSDTGCGIRPEHLPHIFDPYFTVKPRGVGLGLAVVHKLVEAHGGMIEVASTPDRGTEFHIHLPALATDGPKPALAGQRT